MRVSNRSIHAARISTLSVLASVVLAAAGGTAQASAACPNEAVRSQQNSVALPDCRGYELVSPVAKNDQEVTVPYYTTGLEIPYEAAEHGAASTFTMTGGIPGTETAGEFDEGIGLGGEDGTAWSGFSLAPETKFAPLGGPGPRNGGQFVYYSPSLSCGFLKTPLALAKHIGGEAPELAPEEKASEEIENLYLWERAGDTHTLVSNLHPRDPGLNNPYSGGGWVIDGASEGCKHVIFETDGTGMELPLEAGSKTYAPENSLYEWTAPAGEGEKPTPRVASILPDGKPAGEVEATDSGNKLSNVGQMSSDGTHIFFDAKSDEGRVAGESGTKQVFMRLPGSNTTFDISASETATPDVGARFQAASANGVHVLFMSNYGLTAESSQGTEAQKTCHLGSPSGVERAGQGCDLYEYNTETKKLKDLSVDTEAKSGDKKGANVRGVVGISQDGTYIYFATGGKLGSEGHSGEANEAAKPGEANVYVYHEGTISYVATILEEEAGGGLGSFSGLGMIDALSPSNSEGIKYLVARVSPNGQHLLLASQQKLTSFNNLDKNKGTPDQELYEYTYTTGPGSVLCVSCAPSGEQPIRSKEASSNFTPLGDYLQVHGGSLPRNLIDDGRVFFDSFSPLLPAAKRNIEQNGEKIEGMVDVYEWEPDGTGGCEAAKGCTSLLDPGTSAFPTYFEGASEDGENAYLTTPEVLAAQDEDGLRDLYDARVDGGRMAATPKEECNLSKDLCQGEGTHLPAGPGNGSNTQAADQPPVTVVREEVLPPVLAPTKILSHAVHGTVLTLVISVPAAGRLTISGSGLITVKATPKAKGDITIRISLNAADRRAAKRRHLKITVHVSYAPTSGNSSAASTSVTFK